MQRRLTSIAALVVCGFMAGAAQGAADQKKSKHRYGHVSKKDGHKGHDSPVSGAVGLSASQLVSGGDEGTDAGPGLFVGGRVAYRLTAGFSALATAGYFLASGIADPTLGASVTLPSSGSLTSFAAVSVSAPVSEASRDSFKITTVTATGGSELESGSWHASVIGLVAMSWYSKTVIVEEVEAEEGGAGLTLQGHEHHAGSGASSFPEESEGTGDREFNRYGVRGAGGRKIASKIRIDAALGLTQVTHQFGPSTWITEVVPAQATYLAGSYSAFFGLSLTGEEESLSAPSDVSLALGAEYLFD